jgi:deoxyadenosine/deoxycytidine kinase
MAYQADPSSVQQSFQYIEHTVNNSELTDKVIVEKPSLIVEVIGPAGAGKTTLVQALSQRSMNVQVDFPLPKTKKIPIFIRNTLFLLPTFLRHHRNSRWFNWRETRSMAYLVAGLQALRQPASNSNAVTILDHGPIYRLAFLRELGPEITESQRYKRWWTNLLIQWIDIIDVIIWLDAPNHVLWERIRARDRSHSIKEKGENEAFAFLSRYRMSFEETIADGLFDHHPTLLQFDTNQASLENIVNEVLVTFESAH